MAEGIQISSGLSKEQRYAQLFPQLAALLDGETDPVANMANFVAALKQTFGFFWIGFYLVKDNELVLGPFQGEVACTRIGSGKGVCGTTWKTGQSIIVADVDAFPGHIACNSSSRSEIVVPIIRNSQVIGVLDVDSNELNSFDDVDREWLERSILLLKPYLK